MAHTGEGKYGVLYVSSSLWLSSKDNERLLDLTEHVLDGKVTMNLHNAIKMSLTMTLDPPSLLENWVDIVAPMVTLTDWAGHSETHQLGLYIITPGDHTHTDQITTGVVEGRDLCWLLAHDGPTQPYTVASGANVVNTVVGIVSAMGLRYSIPLSSKTLDQSRTWWPDASWLVIVNDLLNAIGYYTLASDRHGVMTSMPYRRLGDLEPSLRLFSGEGSTVHGAILDKGEYGTIANRVVVYKANAQGDDPISAVLQNDDPWSPTSTVSLNGHIKTRWEPNANVNTAAEAQELARRLMEEGSSYTHKLKVTTEPLPNRALHETYDLAIYNNDGSAVGFGLYWCDTWELTGIGTAGMVMSHDIKRLEAYGV